MLKPESDQVDCCIVAPVSTSRESTVIIFAASARVVAACGLSRATPVVVSPVKMPAALAHSMASAAYSLTWSES